MRTSIKILAIAAGYVLLGGLSAIFAYAETNAWAVWLASGLTLGLLLSRPRASWGAIVAGAALGAFAFGLLLKAGWLLALLYAAEEVVTALCGVWVASRIATLPLRLESPRELGALALGALVAGIVGGIMAAAYNLLAGGAPAGVTLRVWTVSAVAGYLLVASLVIAWQQFRVKRSGGLPMPAFVGGAIAAACFFGGIFLVFATGESEGPANEVVYLPLLFLALVALLWGVRGASLAAFAGTVIALAYTTAGRGPFADVEGFLGSDVLEVQGYAVSMALTGLLIAVLSAAQHNALRAAREWKTRFEAAIGAHRLLAYEWDPASGRLELTGDARALLGAAPEKLATLADWLGLVASDDRERVGARFEQRANGEGDNDVCAYALIAPGGERLDATDEARAIRDHDGALHRVVGIVRVAASTAGSPLAA